jgi:hypothetical protein
MNDPDPYSTAMAKIMGAINHVLGNEEVKGKMSEDEYQIIAEIAVRIAELDPDSIHIYTED